MGVRVDEKKKAKVWQCPRCKATYRSVIDIAGVMCVGCSRKLRAPVMGVWMEPKTRGRLKSVPEESA
jgi:protein-arginine kinase activator protein McsA